MQPGPAGARNCVTAMTALNDASSREVPTSVAARILVVDDDPELGRLVLDYLAQFGMAARVVTNGAAMRLAMRAGGFELVLLDLMLPDANGLDLCRWSKSEFPATSVIMLTAQGDPASRIAGLEIGADDYLSKPFEPRELVARIRAVQRRRAPSAARFSANTRFAGWSYDKVSRQLAGPQGALVALSSVEHRLLTALLDWQGMVLTRERLVELLHAPQADVSDRSIDLAISRLRGKLGDKDGLIVRTVRGEGYLLQRGKGT
jgi:two-component system OmpR family response regulator